MYFCYYFFKLALYFRINGAKNFYNILCILFR
jgi:hypothetical protein